MHGTRDPKSRASRLAAGFVRATVLALVALTPWAFGGVEPHAQMAARVAIALALVAWSAQLWLRSGKKPGVGVAVLPPLLGLLLAALQLLPLPVSVLSVVGPGTALWRSRVLPGMPERPAAAEQGSQAELPEPTVSLYPASTAGALGDLAACVAIFLIAARYFQRAGPQRWLCLAAAGSGAGVALFGIVQRLCWNGLLYWSVPLTQGGHPFGPFVNRNNAGGYLNLCLACALGLLFDRSRRWAGQRSAELRAAHYPSAWKERCAACLADLNASRLVLAALSVLIATGVLSTLSRGAAVAMATGGVLTLLLSLGLRPRSSPFLASALLAVAVLILLAWVGMVGPLRERLGTLRGAEAPDGRLRHWSATLRAAEDFRFVGSGLGTYRFVYGLYERQPTGALFYHAENQYLEALVELGAVGICLLVASIALVVRAAWLVSRQPIRGEWAPLAGAGLFAIATQAIHACFDFGLYIPANAFACAAVFGSLVGAASLARPRDPYEDPAQERTQRQILPALALPALSLVLLIAAWRVNAQAQSERAGRAADMALAPGRAPDAAPIAAAIHELSQALRSSPCDAQLHAKLADLYIARYEREAGRELADRWSAEPSQATRIAGLSNPAALCALAHQAAGDDGKEIGRVLRAVPVVERNLVPAVTHLLIARRLCPLLPYVELRLAGLAFLIDQSDPEARYLERARLLAPADPELWFRAGVLDGYCGRMEAATESWKRCLAMSPRYEDPVLDLVGDMLPVERIVHELLPESAGTLVRLAEGRYRDRPERTLLMERAESLLEADTVTARDAWWRTWAVLDRLRGQPDAAIAAYRQALGLAPQQTAWRIELSLLLRDQGLLLEARDEIRGCARQDPASPRIRTLLEQLDEQILSN